MAENSKGFFDGNPKTMFTFGVVSGMAAILLFNSFAGVTFGAGNGNGGGWFGGAGQEADAEENAAAKVAAPVVQGKLAEVTEADHVRGDLSKAKVVIVEYSDFECPFCARHHPTLEDIMDDYTNGEVAWVYRHFPLSFHPEAEPSALASECAAEQGKFWEYADALFENQTQLSEAYYKSLAKELGLKTAQFDDCFDTAKYQDVVDADMASGRAAGVSGTPATFINGVMVTGSNGSSVGAAPKSTFTNLIDAQLK
jgi:protein-disulfide isomerase